MYFPLADCVVCLCTGAGTSVVAFKRVSVVSTLAVDDLNFKTLDHWVKTGEKR